MDSALCLLVGFLLSPSSFHSCSSSVLSACRAAFPWCSCNQGKSEQHRPPIQLSWRPLWMGLAGAVSTAFGMREHRAKRQGVHILMFLQEDWDWSIKLYFKLLNLLLRCNLLSSLKAKIEGITVNAEHYSGAQHNNSFYLQRNVVALPLVHLFSQREKPPRYCKCLPPVKIQFLLSANFNGYMQLQQHVFLYENTTSYHRQRFPFSLLFSSLT